MHLLRASLLSSSPSGTLCAHPDGALLVDTQGRIADLGPATEVLARHPELPVEDLRPLWILPGMVDLHVHLPQHEAVAMDGLELLPWLETFIFPAEARFADTAVARHAAHRFFNALLFRGTTTAVVYSTVHAAATHAAFEEAERLGNRVIMGKVMMDRHAPDALQEDTQASLDQSEALCQAWHGRDDGRLRYAFTPRFAPTCSPELMRGAAERANHHGAYIQTHISENLQELDWVKELFPEAQSYTDVYRRMGLLGPRTLLAHGIHLFRPERALIREAGAALVHCPRSNAFLQSGIMPLRRWMEEGLRIGLGSDVGAGPSLSLWAEAAFACTASKLRWAERQNMAARLRLQGVLDERSRAEVIRVLGLYSDAPVAPVEAFHLATLGGAQALGLEDRIGSLELGKDADLVVVDPRVVDPAGSERGPEPPERVLYRLLYREHPGMLHATYVRGRKCYAREA